MKPLDAPAPRAAPSAVFSMKVVIILLLVGVFSFSAFITLSAFAPDLRAGDARGHALSRSAVGFAAAAQLARAQGTLVSVSRTPPEELESSALIVLTPQAPLLPDQLDGLSHQRVLIILPKWQVMPKPDRPGWVVRLGQHEPEAIASIINAIAPEAVIARAEESAAPALRFHEKAPIGPANGSITAGAIDNLQTISGAALAPVVVTSDGRIVLAQVANRPVYILSDPDFLNTQGLATRATAQAGMGMLHSLRDGDEPIVFDVTLAGYGGDRSVLRLAFEPPFIAATLSLFAAALLLGWRSVAQTGPQAHARRAIALGKRALAENSAALIRLAKREHKMGWGYAMQTGVETAELMGFGRQEGEQIIALLDRVGAAQGVEHKFSDLASEASAAETGAQVLAAARKLHSWKEEMLRATR